MTVDDKMENVFALPQSTFIGGDEKALPLKEIIRRLEAAYCGSIGVEYAHLDTIDAIMWVRERMEKPGSSVIDPLTRQRTCKRLLRASAFEAFLAKKWSSEKR